MKQLSIEEKAKAYDKALERARIWKEKSGMSKYKQGILDDIFPELAKSEDEKMRKWIIDDIRFNMNNEPLNNSEYRKKAEKAITWLEKQGNKPQGKTYIFEGKSVLEAINEEKVDNANKVGVGPKFKVGDEIATDNSESLTITKFDEKGYWSEDLFICSFEDSTKWKLVERLIDKTKPKFKVGDWITDGEKVWKIGYIEDGMYIEHCDSISAGGTIESIDKHYHLWTIEDAKDGDVLCSEQIILLFKKWEYNSNWNCVIAYAGIDVSGKLQITDGHWLISNYTHPATKEQRDLFFTKMKEAGYIFDFEEKKLKGIDNEIEIPLSAKDSELQEDTYYIPKGFHAEIDDDKVVIKKGKQKSIQEIELFEAEHGKYYYCIKDYFCGGKKQASKGDIIQALRGLPIMGIKDASEYFLPVNSIKCNSAWSEEDENIKEDL